MWTTASMLRQCLSLALLLTATYGLAVSSALLPAIFMMGECATGGSTGCNLYY